MSLVISSQPPLNSTQLIEGLYLELVCNVTIDEVIGFNLIFGWSRNGTSLSSSSEYTITNYMYSSTLFISKLYYTRDNGSEYSCAVTVVPTVESSFTASTMSSGNVVLSVESE